VRSDSTGMGNALSEKDLRDLHSLWSVYRDRAASASDVSSSSLQHSKVRVVAWRPCTSTTGDVRSGRGGGRRWTSACV
jgi:hypothetical protein